MVRARRRKEAAGPQLPNQHLEDVEKGKLNKEKEKEKEEGKLESEINREMLKPHLVVSQILLILSQILKKEL